MTEGPPVPAARPRLSPAADRVLRWLALALTAVGALLLLAGVSGGIAFPLVATGAALVAVEQFDKRRGH